MKTLFKIPFVLLVLAMITSCNTGPKEIDYGNDGCHFCKMTIVDKIHGAQLITDKGKVFKFDATECMLSYITEKKGLEVDAILTNYYESPTAFMPTKEATFLISKKLPSPMGAYLTAFKSKNNAAKVQLEKGGVLYNWDALRLELID